MAFKGRDPVRTKIVIDNKIIEQVNLFNHLKKKPLLIIPISQLIALNFIIHTLKQYKML